MAHKITAIDLAIGAVQRHQEESVSWHGLEAVKEDLSTENCGLGEIEVKLGDVKITHEGKEFDSSYKVAFMDHPITEDEILFFSQPFDENTYQLFTPKEFVAFADECFKEANLGNKISFTTTLHEGRQMSISRALPESDFKDARGNEIKTYFNLFNSLDKTIPLFANISEKRTICANTMMSNLNTGGASAKHTPESIASFVKNFPKVLSEAIKEHANSANDYFMMFDIPFSIKQARQFYAYMLAGKESRIGKRTIDTIESDLLKLFVNGRGTKGENGADVFCAVTEYYTHKFSAEANSINGRAHHFKTLAKSLLLNNNLEQILEQGKKVIDNSDY